MSEKPDTVERPDFEALYMDGGIPDSAFVEINKAEAYIKQLEELLLNPVYRGKE